MGIVQRSIDRYWHRRLTATYETLAEDISRLDYMIQTLLDDQTLSDAQRSVIQRRQQHLHETFVEATDAHHTYNDGEFASQTPEAGRWREAVRYADSLYQNTYAYIRLVQDEDADSDA